ncbi:actin monomer binding protein-like protein [Myriangium duriaei CBS 260.36]|uniref:Actin monomer binding protein-like protein n=1 Tax=Myriangium duriaei CBS 260.36 TaxID=1168546 RepID=A0A9P4MKV9_9PEZI|nr:actin monomer binding protein-like protein [Myriangium duriaei CBS 260.36]
MQSGIHASQDLKDAFNSLVSSTSSFAVIASIDAESLIPITTIPSSSGFPSDLSAVQSELSPTVARYILVRRSSAPDGFVGITYVPDAAPVRQKMLFASTRLTLIRELGLERFGETLFCTTAEEVGPKGWERHEAHRKLENPLTQEERANRDLQEQESLEQGGTMRRHGHYTEQEEKKTSGGGVARLSMKTGQGVVEALRELRGSGEGRLVQIRIDVATETLELDSSKDGVAPGALAGALSPQDPRYSFYTYAPPSESEAKIIFIYTCPSSSKIKERMVYAASKTYVLKSLAEGEAGLTVVKSLEGAGPEDFAEETLRSEFVQKAEESKGFARPKRPGRR